jgi:hypothetical protein
MALASAPPPCPHSALYTTCVCGGALFPHLSARVSRHPTSVHRWGVQGGARKVRHPLLWPLPHSLERTAQRAQDPHCTPFDCAPVLANGGPSFAPTRHGNAGPHNTTPTPCDPLMHVSGVHEQARVCPPPPHPSDERAQGWATPWETTPSALIHVRTGRHPHFRLLTLLGVTLR